MECKNHTGVLDPGTWLIAMHGTSEYPLFHHTYRYSHYLPAGLSVLLPYSAKRWRRKTLANQQNIALAKKLWRIANLEDQAEI